MSVLRKKLIKMVKEMNIDTLGRLDTGPLSDHEIAVGMHLSFKNAQELHEEAHLLYRNQRLGRTLSLLVLALEELGRIPILLNAIYIGQDDIGTWKRFWAGLRRHALKQGVWTAYGKQLAEQGHPDAAYFTTLPADYVPLLDRYKQCGFYVTCFDGNFISPDMFAKFDKRKIESLFEIVGNRIKGFKELHSRSLDSYQFVLNCRQGIKRRTEAQLRQEIETILGEAERPRKAKRTTVQ